MPREGGFRAPLRFNMCWQPWARASRMLNESLILSTPLFLQVWGMQTSLSSLAIPPKRLSPALLDCGCCPTREVPGAGQQHLESLHWGGGRAGTPWVWAEAEGQGRDSLPAASRLSSPSRTGDVSVRLWADLAG